MNWKLNTGSELKKLTIGVLMGGLSSEREISLCSGRAVSRALKSLGYKVVNIGEKGEDIESAICNFHIDIAFIALHGRYGEDGQIQSFLEERGIPYVGSGPEASRNALNKYVAKKIFEKNGIPTPRYKLCDFKNQSFVELRKMIESSLGYPVVVKPICEGSSIGLQMVDNGNSLEKAFISAQKYGSQVLVEEYVSGRELTVGILEYSVLPIVEILPKDEFYSFNAKYSDGGSEYVVPAQLSQRVYVEVMKIGKSAFDVLGCRHFGRVDIRLSSGGIPYVLEVNTIPGFTEHSLLPKAAKAVGISFEELCENLVVLAWSQKGVKWGKYPIST